jgi:hypothetical protein
MNAIVKADNPHEIMESVLINGDLSKLTAEERNSYYRAVCTSVGLNPLTKPLEYITLNGKLRLYALKDCTDQLRSIHKVSVTEMTEAEREGVYIVKSKVQNAEGRTDMAIGAVNIAGLKGEALANAMMKCETKSKRRATLSICGLGMLDETEVDDIPAARKAPVERSRVPSPSDAQRQIEAPRTVSGVVPEAIVQLSKPEEGPHKIVGGTYATWTSSYIEAVQSAGDAATVYKWVDANAPQLEKLAKGAPELEAKARGETAMHLAFLKKTEPKAAAEPADMFPGDTPMETTQVMKPALVRRGRPPKPKVPDFAKNYDAWVNWCLKQVAEAETPEEIETLFEAIDAKWDDLLGPDKEALMGARREAESRMEQ